MKKVLTIASLAAISGSAMAGVWVEQGDAPELLPGQLTIGLGSLDAIQGSIGVSNDADLYCIRVVNYTIFRATTNNGLGSLVDTQLFLFDSAGMGVTHNDDDPIGGTLRSTLTAQFLTSNGIYYLGISAYNRDPQGPNGLIWLNSPFNVERAPDGPGAPGPLVSWTGTGGTGTYEISLTGCEFCEVPEPGTIAVIGLGLAALAARRSKK